MIKIDAQVLAGLVNVTGTGVRIRARNSIHLKGKGCGPCGAVRSRRTWCLRANLCGLSNLLVAGWRAVPPAHLAASFLLAGIRFWDMDACPLAPPRNVLRCTGEPREESSRHLP